MTGEDKTRRVPPQSARVVLSSQWTGVPVNKLRPFFFFSTSHQSGVKPFMVQQDTFDIHLCARAGTEGKGKLQWERDIPAAALANLEGLAKGDFKANLGKIIHDIYQTAHTMFADMPQGDHKKRAKYRFASKTLMRILPVSLKAEVEGLIEKKTITLDLYEILGQCTWGQKQAA